MMRQISRLLLGLASASFFYASAQAQNVGTVTDHAFVIGRGAGFQGFTSLLCGSAQLAVGQAAANPICQTITGDAALSSAGALTLATVNSNVGSFGSATQAVALTVNAKGLVTAASASTITPALGSVTGLGTGCATFLATPSSANLRACLTDEVGTGTAYFVGGALGTPASATLTNATGLPLTGLANQAAYTVVANATGSAAAPTAVSIPALTQKASPVANDKIMIADSAASDALKYATISSIATAGSVTSIAANTGAFTLSTGITNLGNDIRLDRGQLPGETGAVSASAGNIGEYVTSNRSSAAALSLTSSTPTNIVATLSLTAGDWDVSGVVAFSPGGSTVTTSLLLGISTTSATLPGIDSGQQSGMAFGAGVTGGSTMYLTSPVARISISGTTTVYLVANTIFTTSTMTSWGNIRARRAR